VSCPETVWLSLFSGQTVTLSVSWQMAGRVEFQKVTKMSNVNTVDHTDC